MAIVALAEGYILVTNNTRHYDTDLATLRVKRSYPCSETHSWNTTGKLDFALKSWKFGTALSLSYQSELL